MYCDLPVLKRCCFCLPLRPGLLAWGYVKLIASLLYICTFSILIYVHSDPYLLRNNQNLVHYIMQILGVVAVLVDAIFNVLLLVSAHKKDHELMKKCLYYNICAFTVSNILFLLAFTFAAYVVYTWGFFLYELLFIFLGIGFINAVLQFYLILLIRSEILKLTNNCNFRFENHAAAARCVMTIGNMDYGLAAPPKEDKLVIMQEEVPPAKD